MYLGKRSADSRTHKWCCYLRSTVPMHYISKVEFILDESFPEPLITLYKQPFEIHQSGWGQFTIGLRIHFHEPHINKPVELGKELVLFDDLPASAKRPIVREDYNEIVFVEPSP